MNWPTIDVAEREKDVRVTAELPGLEEDDVELHVEDNVLTLSGEKRSEIDDNERQYSERYYGRFERRIALPAEVDEDRASATFRNGVLTVTLPKTERARQSTKRIPISH
jgi:HSP20 family protein